ncbi:DUF4339 domain-containing protein [Lignipirellula cremea]|uniref:GYF domain-containing protein n=1 Tax=Lignipirellula cremea TaxID=2528010 RepID=A0A518E3M0_9BACT|nr:DUF4339 domain-containing protein [Lignipirellula cremea]QDU98684.1 hypothetical protein Pla8534_65570 [Lignipirellula cremea]
MGIRFLCPNGHRLNVKTFLAGKRGLCPHCGEGVDIPLESQIESRKKKRSTAVGANGGSPPDEQDDDPDEAQSIPTLSPSRPLVLPQAADSTAPAAAQTPVLPKPTPATASKPAPASTPEATASSAAPAPSLPATPAPAFTPAASSTPAPPPSSPAAADPIDESPAAVWYVRPVSGGQFGPAVGEVMRKWIQEGRVSGDSLVWREGWEEWILAETIFPSLQESAPSTPSISVSPSPQGRPSTEVPHAEPRGASSFSPYRRPPNQSNSMRLAIVILLGVISLALLGVLAWVITSRSSAPAAPAPAAVRLHPTVPVLVRPA